MLDLKTLYRRPNMEAIKQQVSVLEAELQSAKTEETFFETLFRWNNLRVEIDTQEVLAHVMYRQNTQNKEEQEFFDKATPEISELNQRRTLAILKSPFQGAYAARFGQHLIDKARCEVASFHPTLKPLLTQEAKLEARYMEIHSSPEIEFQGKKLTINGLEVFFYSSSRSLRQEAQSARERFLQKKQDELDEIFSSLISLRTQMGQVMGHQSYIPLGYQLRKRTSYGPTDVAAFRQEIEADIVPLVCLLAKQRGERLNVEPLLFHDEPAFDLLGNPKPLGGAAFCIKQAEQMFEQLGPRFHRFYQLMTSRGSLDLEDRPNKAYGAYATAFASEKLPFVSANFNGSDRDIHAFIHECGHAFFGYHQFDAPLLEGRFTTADAAEVHSMGFENLAHPYLHLFFGDDAPRYLRLHMEQQLIFITYAAAIDAFEHEVYQNPSLTAKERCQFWRELEKRFQPYRDYGGLFPFMESGTFWLRQGHLFLYPLYYLDYILAGTCALQLWQRSLQNREEAMEDYLRICGLGGSKSFTHMLENGRFVSPFTKGCLHKVASAVESFLSAD